MSAPPNNRSFAMCTMAGRDLLLRRRPKEVKADTVAGDSSQQSAFGWWTVSLMVLLRAICWRVNCLPCWAPQRIDAADRIQHQVADVPTTFKNRDMTLTTLKFERRVSVQTVRTRSY